MPVARVFYDVSYFNLPPVINMHTAMIICINIFKKLVYIFEFHPLTLSSTCSPKKKTAGSFLLFLTGNASYTQHYQANILSTTVKCKKLWELHGDSFVTVNNACYTPEARVRVCIENFALRFVMYFYNQNNTRTVYMRR